MEVRVKEKEDSERIQMVISFAIKLILLLDSIEKSGDKVTAEGKDPFCFWASRDGVCGVQHNGNVWQANGN